MDTAQLLAFERIVRERSFSRAARALAIAQPTISERIRALERSVGGPLFVRGGRSAELTDLGASFLPFARRALEVLDAGIETAKQTHHGARGRASLGVLESLSGSFLGPALAGFHATHPDVEITVRAGRHPQLMELLLDGVVTMAIVAWPCPESLAIELTPLLRLRERVVLVAAPNHPLARKQTATAEQVALQARPLLVLHWWLELPPPLARLADQAPSRLDVPMDTGRYMVLRGSGAGFFPWMQVAESIQSGALCEVQVEDLPQLERESALIRRTAAPSLSPAARALVETLAQRAEHLGITTGVPVGHGAGWSDPHAP
ncbi:MAG: LysR family transcriptional regulator [Chloroflexi bacterium]|nr:LysR family transcriptional regulator [Chloroflexota bacterium]